MELVASFKRKVFEFKKPVGTSRGVMNDKKAWFISVWKKSNPAVKGIGECSIIEGLSPDFESDDQYQKKVEELVENINSFADNPHQLKAFPSIYFGLEMALLDLKNGGKQILFDTPFTRGEQTIPINGLIWMGEESFMREQIQEKIEAGFNCIKMKIGAIDFEKEIQLLQFIRKRFSTKYVTLRVDANGAFKPENALEKLSRLEELEIHSIEQPIAAKQWDVMRDLCKKSAVPVALDEELIGIHEISEKRKLLKEISPQYIILKPSLIGGFKGSEEWINLAEKFGVQWWMTSALESNVGLNAIAQFTSKYENNLPQGLGTGSLYVQNTDSKLAIKNGEIGVFE